MNHNHIITYFTHPYHKIREPIGELHGIVLR